MAKWLRWEKKQVVTFCGSLCELNFKTHLEHYLMFHQMLSSVTLMVIRQTQIYALSDEETEEGIDTDQVNNGAESTPKSEKGKKQ